MEGPFRGRSRAATALRITRRGAKLAIERITQNDIPTDIDVWWTLNPPPTRSDVPDVIVTLKYDDRAFKINLLTSDDSVVYLKHSQWLRGAEIALEGSPDVSASVGEEWFFQETEGGRWLKSKM